MSDKISDKKLLSVSPSPHARHRDTTQDIMCDVLIALTPALLVSTLVFGLRALVVVAACVLSCVAFEYLFEKVTKRANTIRDFSACVTGVLLAYNLPPTIPIWQAVVGSLFAIVVIKQLFGGIGKNFANPAITARIFMFLAFAGSMARWTSWLPFDLPVDAVTSATPLRYLSGAEPMIINGQPFALSAWQLFVGTHGGCIGETSPLALLIGFAYLLARRTISWETPVIYVGTVFVLSWVFGWNPVLSILSGGLMLGAIFMATDYVTTPVTFAGRIIFAAGAGLLTVVIRVYGSYPEGVSFSILLMNVITPYINRWTMPRPLGVPKKRKTDKQVTKS
jgi:electron transport complex protein RnfD